MENIIQNNQEKPIDNAPKIWYSLIKEREHKKTSGEAKFLNPGVRKTNLLIKFYTEDSNILRCSNAVNSTGKGSESNGYGTNIII